MSADPITIPAAGDASDVGGLLRALVPRAQAFQFVDRQGHCLWRSDTVDDFEVDDCLRELPVPALADAAADPGFLRRNLATGRTLLVVPVGPRADSGSLAVVFSRNAGKSASFNPRLIRDVLAPALGVIAANLGAGQAANDVAGELAALRDELQLIFEIDELTHGTSRGQAGLARLVGKSGRFLEAAYSVLLIPSKRLRISATHSSWKSVNRKLLDRFLVQELLPHLDGRRTPLVFDVPAVDGIDSAAAAGFETLLAPIVDRSGNVEGALALLGRMNGNRFDAGHRRFMAHIARRVEHLVERSYDAMTGLMNRPGFEAQLRECWSTLECGGDSHQLIYFDLDNLQLVNDSFGRRAGDEVIGRFARLLDENLPKNAVVSRLSGDDFCVLLTHADDDAAMAYAKGVRDRISSLRYLHGDQSLQITVSVGIAACQRQDEVGDEGIGKALTVARMACESAKDHGRDRIEVYSDTNLSLIRRQDDLQLVTRIQKALDNDGFQLLAQPIATLGDTLAGTRFEILLRMPGDDGEPISTSAFLSAAERYQMMPHIDRWVVSNAFACLAPHAAMLAGTGTCVSINLSGQSLSDDDIRNFINEELAAAGLAAAVIGFEVTESAAVGRLQKAQALIRSLADSGFRIALDDFGAGLSSFTYLKNFAVDTLKIDGSFIRDIDTNRISESMVAAITQVAKVMELDTVAEYVETPAAEAVLRRLGVDFAQGHHVGRPRPLADVLAELAAMAS